jgi:hypothetical protein
MPGGANWEGLTRNVVFTDCTGLFAETVAYGVADCIDGASSTVAYAESLQGNGKASSVMGPTPTPLSKIQGNSVLGLARPARRSVAPKRPDHLPPKATRHTVPEPSSVTSSEPSLATATPTGLPQTLPSWVTNPTRKSSYSPVALPSFIGTRITL